VRRLAVVCAVAVAIFAAFIAIDRIRPASAAPRQSGDVSGAPAPAQANAAGIYSANSVTVVAANVDARALAVSSTLNAADPHPSIDLTESVAPNRIFTFPVAGSSAAPVAIARIAALAGTGLPGSLGDGGAAAAAQFDLKTLSLDQRSGIAVAPDGAIYIADTGNATVRSIAGSSSSEPGIVRSVAGRWAPGQNIALLEPLGIAVDRAGNLYIADHGAGAVDVMAAGAGQLQTLAQIAAPAGIAVAPDGRVVYVASPDKGAVFSVNTQTHSIETVAALAAVATTSGFLHAGPPSECSPARICPAGLAVDAAGNLFVADANTGRLLRVDAQTSAASIVATGLNQPGEIAFDSAGNLYVAEQGLNRIVAFAQLGASQGSISLSPASATFASTPLGGAGASQTFTLTNTTATAVNGVSVPKATTPADFTVQSTNCTAVLAPNATCTIAVAFTPTATGARPATLGVTDANAGDSASASLTGNGDDFQLQLASGQLMSVSVQAGAAITMNLQVVPDALFSGAVVLSCPNNLPTNTTCAFSTSTVNVSPGAPAPFQVTFQTSGLINPINTLALRRPQDRPRPPRFPSLPSSAAVLTVLVMILMRTRRPTINSTHQSPPSSASHLRFQHFAPRLTNMFIRKFSLPRAASALALLSLLTLTLAVIAGCKKSTVVLGATPSGPTTMNIIGTSQNASRAVTITLNVVTQ
jgi:sugar lactone lactonase YvrE